MRAHKNQARCFAGGCQGVLQDARYASTEAVFPYQRGGAPSVRGSPSVYGFIAL